MSVERFEYEDGDLLVAEVSPSLVPPVRYRGRTFVRIGPRRDIASEAEERILFERRTSYMATFDATPCFGATIKDIDTEFIKREYLPQIIDHEVLASDSRNIKEQLAAIHLYDLTHECPTNAAMILLVKTLSIICMGAMYNTFILQVKTVVVKSLMNDRLKEVLVKCYRNWKTLLGMLW